MNVETALALSPRECDDIRCLIRELSNTAETPSDDVLNSIVRAEATSLVIAVIDGKIIGMLTLSTFTTPTGTRSWIDDVVVSSAYRGRGVASMLTEFALNLARKRQTRTVDLTSRPSRLSANRLYEKIGFERRETNVFRFRFTPC